MKNHKEKIADRYRTIFLQSGAIVALLLVLFAFEWKSPMQPPGMDLIRPEVLIPEEIVLNTYHKTKPIPKPVVNVTLLNIVIDETVVEEPIDIDVSIEEGDDIPVWEPPVIEEKEVMEKTRFIVVEDKPEFPGGEGALFSYLARSITYPKLARELGIEGTVYIQFVVSKTGKVIEAEVMRGIHPSCDDEALRVVQQMPDWTPGKQRTVPVEVIMNVPVRFVLQ